MKTIKKSTIDVGKYTIHGSSGWEKPKQKSFPETLHFSVLGCFDIPHLMRHQVFASQTSRVSILVSKTTHCKGVTCSTQVGEFFRKGFLPSTALWRWCIVNKMVCLYFYHPGGAPWFSWFFVFLFGAISGAFLCVPACFFWCGFPVFFVVLFLVSFGDFAGGIFCAFPGAFSTVFWCFFPCIFSCLSLFFSIYVSPWWWSCFLTCFFWWFLGAFSVLFLVLFFVFLFCVFFVPFIVLFSCIFSFFLVLIFVLFFVPWAAPKTSNHNILHFGPCVFWCFFWWSLLVKIGNKQCMCMKNMVELVVEPMPQSTVLWS